MPQTAKIIFCQLCDKYALIGQLLGYWMIVLILSEMVI